MPQAPPPAGHDGLPAISTRAFQLSDFGFSPWAAVFYAVSEYVAALVRLFGREITDSIGQIGV